MSVNTTTKMSWGAAPVTVDCRSICIKCVRVCEYAKQVFFRFFSSMNLLIYTAKSKDELNLVAAELGTYTQ